MGSNTKEVLETPRDLLAWFEDCMKPSTKWGLGTEHEKLGFYEKTLTPIPYEGETGIRAMLEALMGYGWRGKYEGEALIGLAREDGASVTLEPGGQLELSGAVVDSVHKTYHEIGTHLEEVRTIAAHLGHGYLATGFSPLWTASDASQMPKGRYGVMRDYMERCGTMGLDMMHLSCTVQVNLDYGDEKDMVEKLRIALALQPISTALFANSPFKGGKPTGYQSHRAYVWQHTDNDRTGMLPFVFEPDFGFKDYIDYALNVPMYFVIRDNKYINCIGENFRDFMLGKLPQLPSEKPTPDDWENHLTTIFPEARLKSYIEMRGADCGDRDTICALSAFWVGLLYDDEAQSAATELIKDWTAEERDHLYRQAPRLGLKTPFRQITILELAHEVLAISEAGLRRRATASNIENETPFLAPLQKIAENGETVADRLLAAYHNEWNGDIRNIFKENLII